MGCDIHMYCEVKGEDNIWRLVGGFVCDECGGTGALPYPGRGQEKCYLCEAGMGIPRYRIYSQRHYSLFGVLAAVRNQDIQRIDGPGSWPRGIPEDISYALARGGRFISGVVGVPSNERETIEAAQMRLILGSGGECPLPAFDEYDLADGYKESAPSLADHSYSWFTVAELLAFDWEQPTKDYAGGETTLRELMGPPWWRAIEQAQELNPPDRVRFVFGFDS